LGLYLAPLDALGQAPRRLSIGSPGDVTLLDAPLSDCLAAPTSSHVRLTLIDGNPAWQCENC
jgi:hypothetical protein